MAASGADGNICLLSRPQTKPAAPSALSLDIAHDVHVALADDDDVHDHDSALTTLTRNLRPAHRSSVSPAYPLPNRCPDSALLPIPALSLSPLTWSPHPSAFV